MNSITGFIKRYPMGVFWGIAYLVSGGGYVLSRMYPNDLWVFVLWGVALGGLFVTAIADGRAGVKTFLSRIVRWRVGIQWYAVALLTPFALGLLSVGLTILSGAQVSAAFQFPEIPQIAFFFALAFFTIALGEEPGFRGFALPRLLVGRSGFAASLILGVLHAVWHLPLVIGGDEHFIFLINPLCAAVLFTWVFKHTNGSVLLAMLLHAASDTSAGLFSSMFSGADAVTASIWLAVAFIGTAIALRFFAGAELGRKPQVVSGGTTIPNQPMAVK